MANPDRARKLFVRSALVTSTTIATFVGAQNLAMLDATRLETMLTPSPEVAIVTRLPETTMPVPVNEPPQSRHPAGGAQHHHSAPRGSAK